MAVALPDGYVDTGITLSYSLSGEVALWMFTGKEAKIGGTSGTFRLYGEMVTEFNPACAPPDQDYIARIWIEPPGHTGPTPPPPGTPVLGQEKRYVCQFGVTGELSQSFSYSESAGPFRLGVKYELIGAAQFPQFALHYKLTYKWFADVATVVNASCGPAVVPQRYWITLTTTPPAADAVVEQGLLAHLGVEATVQDASVVEAKFRGLTSAGWVWDTSDLNQTIMKGVGSGAVDAKGNGTDSASAKPPYTLSYDLDIEKNGGGSTGAKVDTVNQGTVTTPYAATKSYRNVSWAASGLAATHEALSVNAVWAAAQVPAPWDAQDLGARLWAMPARSSPGTNATYSPITAVLAASLNVHRPDGAIPSTFANDPGKITVTEGAGATVFDVAVTGGVARRQLGAVGTDLPEWRKWLGVGTLGKSDPLFNPDRSGYTKHTSGADIFDWSSYGYAKISLTAPASGTLTLTVEGVQVSVSDNHETGASRSAAFSVTETPYTKTWSLPVQAGANTLFIDLLFPAEGGPFYHGRIDAIKLTGFATGQYALSGFSLISCTAPQVEGADEVYLKCGFGKAVQRSGNYDAIVAAHNGAWCLASTTDRTQCSEIAGQDGHGVRFINVLTGSGTGTILDSQLPVQTFWETLGQVEGWTITYSISAYESANKDSFGSTLAPELAEWTNDLLPDGVRNAGEIGSIACQPKCGQLHFTNGRTFLIRTRDSKGFGSIDILTKDEDGGRGGLGETVELKRNDTGAVFGTTTTDPHGYAQANLLPANGSFVYQVSSDLIALIARDRQRASAIVAGVQPFHLDLLQHLGGLFWFRSYRDGALAKVERSIDQGASWPQVWTAATDLVETGQYRSAPTLAATRWDQELLAYHAAGPIARIRIFNPQTDVWDLHGSHAGLWYPRLLVQTHRSVLTAHDGTDLRFYASNDYGATIAGLGGLTIPAVPMQLCVLRQDRRGWLHIIYRDASDTLLHRYSEDGSGWSAAATLAINARYPGYAQVLPSALVTYFEDGTLRLLRLSEDYRSLELVLTAPPGAWKRGHLPIYQSHRDEVFAVGQIGAELKTRYTPDRGVSWAEPS